ncbi:MAG: hypothetical protein D4R57_01505, partial [Verrucomicrobiales bacterium]
MTVQQIVLHMLSYIGVRDLNPTNNSIVSNPGMASGGAGAYGDIQFALNKLNMAMQQVFREGPATMSERPGGTVLKAPRQVVLNVTQYSTAITVASGWASDMVGCSVLISGDAGGENTFLSQTKLRRPHPGATGQLTCTVYHDSVCLLPDVRAIIDPIELPNRYPALEITTSQKDFDSFNSGYVGTQRRSAQPRAVLLDSIYDGAMPVKVIKFNPMPDQIYDVRWYEKIDPTPYVLTDVIGSGNESVGPFTDPNKVLPVHWVESVLLPIATELFISHPSFSNPAAAA